jgi:predicted nucleic acid-binding Zn ribbon protein
MIMSLWGPIVGGAIAKQCRDLHFEGSRLIVHVASSGWRHELHMQRYSIMKRLNSEVEEDIISEIIVRS